MTFPASKKAYVTVHQSSVPLDFGRLRNQIKTLNILPALPDRLTDPRPRVEGYYYLDEHGPVSAHQWLAFGVRTYSKNVDPKLLQREVRARCDAWLRDNRPDLQQPPADERQRIKQEARDELTKATLPRITEQAVLLDTKQGRVFLFESSGPAREEMLKRVRSLCSDALGQDVQFSTVTLERYLLASRPGAALPGETGEMFVEWLARRALSTAPWCRIPLQGGVHAVFRLRLDSNLSLSTASEGVIHVTGDADVEQMAAAAIDDALSEGRKITALRVSLQDAEEHEYSVRFSGSGAPTSLKLVNARELSGLDDMDRTCRTMYAAAEEWSHLWERIVLLWEAFNRGPLQTWMDGEPQGQFWPGGAIGPAVWEEEGPEPSDDGAQGSLVAPAAPA